VTHGVACSGGCGREVDPRRAWQRFTMLRHLGTKGGGRQRTKAGRGVQEFYCTLCADRLDHEAKGQAVGTPLFEAW